MRAIKEKTRRNLKKIDTHPRASYDGQPRNRSPIECKTNPPLNLHLPAVVPRLGDEGRSAKVGFLVPAP